jgi:DedD protein
MDSRAKQRLTGAVILVALFVLLVPELLRGPHGADATGANGEAGNAADDGMRRYTIDLNANNPATPAAPQENSSVVSLPQPEAASPRPANPLPANSGAANSGPSTPASANPEPSTAGQLAQPGEAAAPAVTTEKPSVAPTAATTKPAAQTPATTVAATPVKPTPAPVQSPTSAPRAEAQKPAAATTAASGSFAVQLGSFGVRDNADRLVRDMTAKGFAAFVSPIKSGGREIYRVRVGPTRDRAQAEALATQLRRIGQSGAIVPIS